VDVDSSPRTKGRARWVTAAALVVVAVFFAVTLAARWREVISLKWQPRPGVFALACVLLALSYALVACLWGLALRRAAGTPVRAGARIWFLANLARYVPGNVWSFVGAVELARREGVARSRTLAVMALTQVLSVGVALLAGLPVLLAERARLGRPALLGAVAVAVVAAGGGRLPAPAPRARPPPASRAGPRCAGAGAGHRRPADGRLRRLLGGHRPGLRRPGRQRVPAGAG
jgi:uncharacterized membrane protein YbhN (UPF0104 family)